MNPHRNVSSPQSSRKRVMAVTTFAESTRRWDQTDSFLTVSRNDPRRRTLNTKETQCVIKNPLYFRQISLFLPMHYHLHRRGASPKKYRLVSRDPSKGNLLAIFHFSRLHVFLLWESWKYGSQWRRYFSLSGNSGPQYLSCKQGTGPFLTI